MNELELVGRCVEAGDDDEGQPRLLIHTTREQLGHFGCNLVFANVVVQIASPSEPPVRCIRPVGDRDAYENDVAESQKAYDANPSSMNHADLYAAKCALRRHCPTEPCVLCSGNGWRKVWFQGRLEERTCCDCHGKGIRPVRPNGPDQGRRASDSKKP